MRPFILILGLSLATGTALGQQEPDTLVSYYTDSRAFLWPQPFAHVPQTFEAQAVRFSAPYFGGIRTSRLEAIELRVDVTSRSQDNFNDTLRISFLFPDEDGRPDPANPAGEALDVEFAELTPGQFNTLPVEPFSVYLEEGLRDVWVVFELIPSGTPDELVLVSGPKTDPPLFRAAARVAGQGWMLLHETQFGAEFNYHVGARFREVIQSSTEIPDDAGGFIARIVPQPARDEAVIGFQLPSPQAVKADLFDVLGRQVRSAEATPGAETIRLDTRDLPAGLYVVHVQAGPHRAAKPLVVAR